jgi:hypothetical protein
MSKFFVLVVLAIALLQANNGGEPEETQGNPELQRQEIVNIENETARAIQLNNATFFRRIYSEDFSGTLSHGQTVDKTQLIRAVQDPAVKYDSFNVTDLRIRFYKDTAVTSCLWSWRGSVRGQRTSSQMRVLHIYINSPRGWQAVATQTTPLPPVVPQSL